MVQRLCGLGQGDTLALMDNIRQCVCFAVTTICEDIFLGVGESGTGGCLITVINALVCGKFISGAGFVWEGCGHLGHQGD